MSNLFKKRYYRSLALLLVLFLSLPALAQTINVTGRVQDVNGEPLLGVVVTEKGTQNRTVTDVNGTYNITVKKGSTLVATYMGFTDEERNANNTLVDFVLKEQVSKLDEVVVTGYTTQKKVSVLGAQSSLKMEHVKAPVANMSTILAGRVSGVVAVQRTGVPGQDDADIWVRGLSTLTNRNEGPLVLVDGIERNFNQLDPEDIESITVLKDAASTAVYGVRGGNGVIIIKTKPGIVGKPKFSFDIYQGITSLTRTPELVDGIEYMNAVNEAYQNSKGSIYYSDRYITNTKIANGMRLTPEEQAYAESVRGDRTINKYLYPNVDWMDELYHKYGYNRRYNVNIRGGAPNATYYVSLSYYTEKGLTKTDKKQDYSSEITYDRYNFLTNVNLKATKTTNVDIGVSGWLTSGNYPAESLSTIFSKAMQTNPVIYPVQYPNGENPGISPDNRELDSPWVTLTRRGYQRQHNTQINTNLKLTQDLGFWNWSKGLSWRALVSFDVKNTQSIYYRVDDSTWSPSATLDPTTGTWVDDEYLYDEDGNIKLTEQYKGNSDMSVTSDKWVYRTFYFETALDYKRTFARKHNVSGLVLFNLRNYLDANSGSLFSTLPYKQQSLSMRLTYDYDNRYFAEFNGGYTGSENFEPGHRFGFFPAWAIGWVPSNEPWWKPISNIISFMKIRYSNGYVGNDSSGDRFSYFTKMSNAGGSYSNYWTRNGASGSWYYSSYGYKPQWSKVHKQDLGIEMNLFKDDLTIVVDLFKEHRTKIFVERANMPFINGFETNPYANVGVVDNKGIEASFEYNHQFGKDWLISLRGNIAYNKDEVIENAQAEPAYPWLDRRGHNVLASWGYVAEGLYTSEEQIKERNITQFGESYPGQLVKPGDIMYKDLNGDGHIDDYDQTCISRGDLPAIYYGFGGDFRYKNIGLGILFQGTADADRILSGNGIMPFQSSSGGGTLYSNITNRWSPDDPTNTDVFYPRLAWGATDPSNENNYVASTWWKRDMSFLRLKQFTISYYFPKSWKGAVLQGGRFYLMGENVFTWSKFKLWDPELNTSNGISYPNVRTFSIGVSFDL
ncbi:MAG: SusC/RagA family TonB-linked outer membrane protein [Prevotella sp.]